MPYTLPEDLDAIRAEIPITQHRKFFNTGWAGPECRASMGAQANMISWLNTVGISHHAMVHLRELNEVLRRKVAGWVSAPSDSIVLTKGVVDGMNIVWNGMSWGPEDHVITTSIEHSGALVPLYVLRDRYDVQLEIVQIEDHTEAPGAIDAACKDNTKLIVLSHVSYNTGARLDLEAICANARAKGIRVLVDAAQSVGAIPLDLPQLGADYYAMPGHKWLLGPETTGALYIHPGAEADLELSHTGYDTAGSFDLDGHYELRPGPQKFEGIDVNPVAAAGWDAAMDFAVQIGQTAMSERIASLTDRLKARLAEGQGFHVATPQSFDESAGLIGLWLEAPDTTDVVWHDLLEQEYVVRHTPNPTTLRISVNFFNTEDEVDGLADAIIHAVDGRRPS